MRQQKRLSSGFAALAALGLAAGQSAAESSSKPNVLFIAIDDMNDWTTLFDQNNPIKTPNLERLAARGCFFSKAYCAAPGCNPSRTALLTGLFPTSSGVYAGNPWREALPDAVTIPQYFAKYGYATRGAGKIYHPYHPGTLLDGGRKPDFQDFFQKLPERKSGPNYNGYTEGLVGNTSGDWGEHAEKMIDVDTVEWVEDRMDEKWDRPLFLAAGLFRPHLPFYAPPAIFEQYPFDETRMPPMPPDDLGDVPPLGVAMAHGEFERYQKSSVAPVSSPGSLKKMVQSYQASATFADSMVGRLLDKLDAGGRADNTIIVLWADHGYHLGDKENCVKFTLWEKANHVPFIIVAPGITTAGSRCDRPVSLVDIYPTLLELCGLPPKADNDGQSLVPLLKNPQQEWTRPARMTQMRGNHAIRTGRWRYIHYKDGSEELYDHDNDPWEITNLASDVSYAPVIAAHKKWLPKTEKAPYRSDHKETGTEKAVSAVASPAFKAGPNDILIADFEGETYGDWQVEGTAFGRCPSLANIKPKCKVAGYQGRGLVNSSLGGDPPTGMLTSPEFTIERKKINFLIGAGNHDGKTCMNLLVDGEVVRTAVGSAKKDAQRNELLVWHSWDVAAFAGKKATLQIVDHHSGGWGHINVDYIVQSD
jgi:arylsulfatase A-like enzyme